MVLTGIPSARQSSKPSAARKVAGKVCFYLLFAFLRAAQYFRIRSPTAFRCAADIFERLRLGGSTASATPRADLAMVRRAVLETVARSGNALSRDATSVWSSFQRASAPRRAQVRMSFECLAITSMLRRLCAGCNKSASSDSRSFDAFELPHRALSQKW